ncbi:hypothetical protein [Sagittula salina]|uniref:AAA+ family ATPase n=1 Tax=Sagittula salina TaxID=2820268 RepID=A0A940S1N1_9RHOB|nr:hypothetical protein [Sagittula salina]MBP0481114.1 hypothetical protein [Sagittula salina]
MKSTVALLSLALLAMPVAAQETDESSSLMEEGARLFFRGLMSEMEPTLDELESTLREMQPVMRNFLTEMGPALRDVLEMVEDWSLYEPPEMLPNGDIVIRRKEPITPENAEPDAPAEIEL